MFLCFDLSQMKSATNKKQHKHTVLQIIDNDGIQNNIGTNKNSEQL